jgi:hypothetical protein
MYHRHNSRGDKSGFCELLSFPSILKITGAELEWNGHLVQLGYTRNDDKICVKKSLVIASS